MRPAYSGLFDGAEIGHVRMSAFVPMTESFEVQTCPKFIDNTDRTDPTETVIGFKPEA